MKKADASGATFALILGEEEVQTGEVTVKLLRSKEREHNQVRIQQEQVVGYLINEITGKNGNLEEDHPPHYH
jgi:histidyl-tRNA synthetase